MLEEHVLCEIGAGKLDARDKINAGAGRLRLCTGIGWRRTDIGSGGWSGRWRRCTCTTCWCGCGCRGGLGLGQATERQQQDSGSKKFHEGFAEWALCDYTEPSVLESPDYVMGGTILVKSV